MLSRSSSAVVILASPKTLVQFGKGEIGGQDDRRCAGKRLIK